jgi:hypothetical protein
MTFRTCKTLKLVLASLTLNFVVSTPSFASESLSDVKYKTVTVDGQEIFYNLVITWLPHFVTYVP